MKRYYELTWSYIKKQYKFTLSVVAAITIATALIVCMLILNKSHVKNAIEGDEYSSGKYHSVFYNLRDIDNNKLKKDNRIKEVYSEAYFGFGRLKNGLGINIEGLSKNTLNLFDYTLSKGRFPRHNGEIALEKWMLYNLRLKRVLGQKLNFDYINCYRDDKYNIHQYRGRAQFKLVGILNDNRYSKSGDNYAITTIENTKKSLPDKFFFYKSFVIFKNFKAIGQQAKGVEKSLNNKSVVVRLNDQLVNDYEAFNDNGYDFKSMSLLMDFFYNNSAIIFAVALIIYNIFSISIFNRFKDYGILKAIGAKASQLRVLIFGEAFLLSVVSIPLGLVLGIASSKIFIMLTNKTIAAGTNMGKKIFIPVNSVIIALIIIFIAVMVSVILPALRAGRISPLEAIKRDTGYYESKPLIGRIYDFFIKRFEINVTMAFQNIWRNKKRFFTAVLCMSICGSVFLDKSNWESINEAMDKIYLGQMPYIFSKAQFRIMTNPYNNNGIKTGYSERDFKDLKKLQGVSGIESSQVERNSQIIANKKIFKAEYNDYCKKIHYEPSFYCGIIGKDSNNLNISKRFIVSGKVDISAMKNSNFVLIENRIYDFARHKDFNISRYKVGDIIKMSIPYRLKNGKVITRTRQLKIGGVLSGHYIAADNKGRIGLNLIMHNKLFKKLTNCNTYQSIDIYSDNIYKNPRLSYELRNISMRIPDGYYMDSAKEIENGKTYDAQNKVISNGILLSLLTIAILNIFNAMSASILQRKRELTLLKIIGDTKRQLNNMIITEGLIYGLISALLSFALGNLFTCLSYPKISKNSEAMRFTISWRGTLILFGATIFISVIAALIPLTKIKGEIKCI